MKLMRNFVYMGHIGNNRTRMISPHCCPTRYYGLLVISFPPVFGPTVFQVQRRISMQYASIAIIVARDNPEPFVLPSTGLTVLLLLFPSRGEGILTQITEPSDPGAGSIVALRSIRRS